MSLTGKALDSFVELALRASEKAGRNSLKLFESSRLKVQTKLDKTPVTRADQEAEAIIRDLLERKNPSHSIVGEEFGESGSPESDFRWWIDPIDGTLQFIRGLPFWGSVVGLEYREQVVAGVLHFPALKLSLWARKKGGTFANGKKVKVSRFKKPEEALLLHSSLKALDKDETDRLIQTANGIRDNRGIGDAFGHSLVIRGHAEAMVDFRVNAYDVSAVKICVEEAGGVFTSLDGKDTIHERSILSGSAALHPYFLAQLRRNAV